MCDYLEISNSDYEMNTYGGLHFIAKTPTFHKFMCAFDKLYRTTLSVVSLESHSILK